MRLYQLQFQALNSGSNHARNFRLASHFAPCELLLLM